MQIEARGQLDFKRASPISQFMADSGSAWQLRNKLIFVQRNNKWWHHKFVDLIYWREMEATNCLLWCQSIYFVVKWLMGVDEYCCEAVKGNNRKSIVLHADFIFLPLKCFDSEGKHSKSSNKTSEIDKCVENRQRLTWPDKSHNNRIWWTEDCARQIDAY